MDLVEAELTAAGTREPARNVSQSRMPRLCASAAIVGTRSGCTRL